MRAEQLPSPHRELASVLADSPGVHLLVAERTGAIVWANDTACATLGRSRDQLDGVRVQTLLPDADADRLERTLGEDTEPGARLTLNLLDLAQSPHTLTVSLHTAAGYIALVGEQDARIEPRAQRALMEVNQELAVLARERSRAVARERRATAAAEQAVRSRDNAVATIVHELRQPLGVMGFALELAREASDERTRELALAKLQHQLEHLTVMVTDLLEVARLQAGKLALRPRPVDLGELVHDVAESYRAKADQAGIALSLQRPPTAVPVAVDPGRLNQVLSNLIENAIKFSPSSGRVEVALVHDAREATLTVRDRGRGIASSMLPHVFELFSQEASGEQDGLGIGLAISRAIVEAHQGRIEAHSDGPGTGAEFVVRLPAALDSDVELARS